MYHHPQTPASAEAVLAQAKVRAAERKKKLRLINVFKLLNGFSLPDDARVPFLKFKLKAECKDLNLLSHVSGADVRGELHLSFIKNLRTETVELRDSFKLTELKPKT